MIVQAGLRDGRWSGRADVLRRVPTPERFRRVVLRDRRHQARAGDARGHHPAARPLLGDARPGPGPAAGALPRRHAGTRRQPLLPHRRLRGLLPPGARADGGDRRPGRRARRRRALSRAGGPLRSVPLVCGMQREVAWRRSPLDRRRHLAAPAPRARGPGHTDSDRAGADAGAPGLRAEARRRRHVRARPRAGAAAVRIPRAAVAAPRAACGRRGQGAEPPARALAGRHLPGPRGRRVRARGRPRVPVRRGDARCGGGARLPRPTGPSRITRSARPSRRSWT